MTIKDRFWAKVNKTKTCWLWTGATRWNGYGKICIPNPNKLPKQIHLIASRVSYELEYGKITDPNLCVCHKCDNKLCVRPEHLFLGTRRDNFLDMRQKNRQARGENVSSPGESNPAAKLKNRDVLKIRSLYKTGKYTQTALGQTFKVCQQTIRSIVFRKNWRHI